MNGFLQKILSNSMSLSQVLLLLLFFSFSTYCQNMSASQQINNDTIAVNKIKKSPVEQLCKDEWLWWKNIGDCERFSESRSSPAYFIFFDNGTYKFGVKVSEPDGVNKGKWKSDEKINDTTTIILFNQKEYKEYVGYYIFAAPIMRKFFNEAQMINDSFLVFKEFDAKLSCKYVFIKSKYFQWPKRCGNK